MIRLAILDDYVHAALRSADWGRLAGAAEIAVFDAPFASREAAAAALQPFDALCVMRERTPFPRPLIQSLPNLKLIVTSGGVNRSIDVAAAKERGVLVCGTTGRDNSASTVELTWALLLALARFLPHQELTAPGHHWQTRLGVRLAGKTIGLVGLGKIGSRVAGIAAAFGMRPIAWSPNLTQARAAAAGAERVEKVELFARADVVSVHIVLSARTRGLIGAPELSRMKPSALLVNTSRGPIVQEQALLDALGRGAIAGAGLDVYDVEPLPETHPFRRAPNVVLTPHLGYATADNFRDFYADMLEDVEAWMKGAPIRVLEP